MTAFKDLRYRSVYNGIIVSRNKDNTVAIFNSVDDVKKTFLYYWEQPNKIGKPDNFSRLYPDLYNFEFNSHVMNFYNNIKWSENELCFITLNDGRVLVGSPRILEDGEK